MLAPCPPPAPAAAPPAATPSSTPPPWCCCPAACRPSRTDRRPRPPACRSARPPTTSRTATTSSPPPCSAPARPRRRRARAALAAPRRGRGSRAVARRLVDVVVGLDRCADPALVGALYERIVEAAREPAARAAAQTWNDAVRAVVADLLADESLALAPDVALAIVDGSVLGWLLDGGDAAALVDRVAAVLDALTPSG